MSIFCENRTSFERFGDDLSEVILSFLPITDKLRLEYVSKQIQRLIFNKQYDLDIHVFGIIDPQFGSHLVKCLLVSNEKTFHKIIDKKAFECVLKKFRFIKSLNICDQIIVDNCVIELIANNCHHLQELIIDAKSFDNIDEKYIRLLGQKCGSNLKSIDFSYYCSYYNNKSSILYEYTPNIKEFCFNDLKIITSKRDKFYSKLDKIVFGSQSFPIEELTRFSNSYSNQIKSISIGINNINDSDHKIDVERELFKQLSIFKNLEYLWLDLSDDSINYRYIEKGLQTIGINCKKLKHLDFETDIQNYSDLILICDKFCKIFTAFKSLIKCKFVINYDYGFDEINFNNRKIQSFDSISSLESLHLNIPLLNDKHFDSVFKFLPKLQTLEISSQNCIISDKTLNNLSKIPLLSSLEINKINADIKDKYQDIAFKITDNGFIDIMNNCPKIEKIDINDAFFTILTEKSINSILKMKINPKKPLYSFSFYDTFNGKIRDYLNELKDSLPQNLEIHCCVFEVEEMVLFND